MLAQSSPEWLNVVASLTSVGFAVWYGWYVTTCTIPKLVENFRDELKLERDAFARALDRIADKFVCHEDKD